MDLTKTITPKSDQLNADDLIAGSITITITGIKGTSDAQQPVSISYDGDNGKPYKPCKSMRRVLVNLWGADGAKYVGRKLTLYRDDSVVFGGIAVGGIRISHASDIAAAKTMALTASKTIRKPYTVQPLSTKPTLTPGTDLWQKVAAKKPTREQVLAHYEISDEHLKQLIL
jgi:hypothetical protein